MTSPFKLIGTEPLQLNSNDPVVPPILSPVLYEHARYGLNDCCIRVMATENWEWGTLSLEMDCEAPPENHWLEYCFNTTGPLDDILCLTGRVEQFLMEYGIAPGQPLYLHIYFESFKDYWGEYDEIISYEMAGVIPWDRERALTAWEAFYGRKYMMVFG